MSSLVPPFRPYMPIGSAGSPSARTSTTRIEVNEGDNIVRAVEQLPIETTSHELPPLTPTKELSPVQHEEKPKDPPEASGATHGEPQVPQTPQVYITFLVISGRRRTMSFEPETTMGRVKELVWSAWPAEWEDERPLAPSYLRLLYLGKMLQDDDTLSRLKFPTHTPNSTAPTPTIVHLSVRPFAPQGENDLKKKRNRNRPADGNIQSPAGNTPESASGGCCGCVIC